ncbi:hypothetical protein K502DRAFT_365216 [Neoconidiobolus thromboides FSU 785]|nr:hypothetical protein K502DRAFT_365216 [Neoconidiobolus thromboides FSU 785]
MSIQFECLPEFLVEEIFKLLDPAVLFEFRFLSKYLSKLVDNVIKYNLTYSAYDDIRVYQKHQQEFIEEHVLSMKHINIVGDKNIRYLDSCPNLVSIYYKKELGSSNKKINSELSKLKWMVMDSDDHQQTLKIFNNYLGQLKGFEVIGINVYTREIIKYLNPNKLVSFKIYSRSKLYLDGLDKIKANYNKLNVLHFKTNLSLFPPVIFSSNLSFASNLKLEIQAKYKFNLECFGNIKQFKSIKLIDFPDSELEKTNAYDNVSIFKSNGIITKAFFDSNFPIKYDVLKLPTLKYVHFKELSKEILTAIQLLPNIQVLSLDTKWSSIKEIFGKSNLNDINLYDEKHNSIKCKFIKEIKIKEFHNTLKEFYCFLSLFPYVEELKTASFDLTDFDENISYHITTRLSLLTPYRSEQYPLYKSKLRYIRNTSWVYK